MSVAFYKLYNGIHILKKRHVVKISHSKYITFVLEGEDYTSHCLDHCDRRLSWLTHMYCIVPYIRHWMSSRFGTENNKELLSVNSRVKLRSKLAIYLISLYEQRESA